MDEWWFGHFVAIIFDSIERGVNIIEIVQKIEL